MMNIQNIQWRDPRKIMWGFHVHQELPLKDFSRALVIQKRCADFLTRHGVCINADDAIKPGYGPHLEHMWELRVENEDDTLEKMGLAISYLSINRLGLNAYIHPVMHDPLLSDEDALKAEGLENQMNALWFSQRVNQDQGFFFHPPKDKDNHILDTRTSRVFSEEEKEAWYLSGKQTCPDTLFLDPYEFILNGFHIHMDFTLEEEQLALTIFDHFLLFLLSASLRPTSTRIYGVRENGPHIQAGWEVKFETTDKNILKKIGIAIGWLMCNRQHLSVFIHPVTWVEGDHAAELKAHESFSMFIGDMPPLDLNFFGKMLSSPDKIAFHFIRGGH